MPNLDFLIHLPLLRIEESRVPFGNGQLYRMPFKKYDEISLGAFNEQQKDYEATEPVFLCFSVPVSPDGLERRAGEVHETLEFKLPDGNWEILDRVGLECVTWAHREVAVPAWTALLLIAPGAAIAPPFWSQTFMAIDGGFTIRVADRLAIGVRVQGSADHEYLFLSHAPSDRFTSVGIAQAAELVGTVKAWDRVPELHAALATLRAIGLPVLSRQDRLTIAVQALESLLLPDVQTTLKKTFARRAAALLATDHDSIKHIETVAADLYRLRSESIHGDTLPDESAALEDSVAERLLAASIRAVGARVSSGQTIDAIRADLDRGRSTRPDTVRAGILSPPGVRASRHRLLRQNPSIIYVPTSSMVALDGHVCCWSPLLGLATEGMSELGLMLLGDLPAPVVMPLSPQELWNLEERDIRRDYLMKFVLEGHLMSVLATAAVGEADPETITAITPSLARMRDLGVVTLRLAGFDQFHDPELFGTAIFAGSWRYRRPTVLRQTIAAKLGQEPTQRVGPADQPRLRELWGEMWRYESGARAQSIEHVLGLFRRSFDRDFLDFEQRAVILVSLFEALLGRFRPRDERVQLEDLAEALLGPGEDVAWFRAEGRKFRNRVAHGEVNSKDPIDPLERMSRLASRIVLWFITTWNQAVEEERRKRPSVLLIQRATHLLNGDGA